MTRIFYADLWGARESKYEQLLKSSVRSGEWKAPQPHSPFYLFAPQDADLRAEYHCGWRVTDVMPVNVLGFQTHRDSFAIDFDESALRKRIEELRDQTNKDSDLRDRYDLRDNRDWQLAHARKQVQGDRGWGEHLIRCLYRPFDYRICYFSTVAMDYPRRELLDHVAGKKNICLNTVRQTKMETWQHGLVSNSPAPAVYVELKDGSNLFPLYLYSDSARKSLFDLDGQKSARRPNLTAAFITSICSKLELIFTADGRGDLDQTIGPEDIFHYIYTIFHSPTYRARYAEFLKIDFPRVPLTYDVELFRHLCAKGADLVALHLLEDDYEAASWNAVRNFAVTRQAARGAASPPEGGTTNATANASTKATTNLNPLAHPITRFVCSGATEVAKGHPKYTEGSVFINPACRFEGVPAEVWNFHIGGYQVCEKWLKDRRGRTLSAEDIAHYQRVVVALKETVRLMAEIDEVIAAHGGWPLVGSQDAPLEAPQQESLLPFA